MHEKIRLILEGLVALFLLVLLVQGIKTPGSTMVGTEYQAVVMDDGQVYFGKLENLESEWPVLRDVYFVQQRGVDPEGRKEQALVKRSLVLHMPDHMVINASHVRLVEPVSEHSKMMQLISAAAQQQTQTLEDVQKSTPTEN